MRNAVPLRPRELDLPALLSMLEEIVAAKFRLERTAVELLQAEEVPGAASPALDERAHMSLHSFFYEHLRKKYIHTPPSIRTACGPLASEGDVTFEASLRAIPSVPPKLPSFRVHR